MNNLSDLRVLVVEDEVFVAWLLEEMLTALGCIMVGPAARVEQALTMIETVVPFDVAVLDINLNGEKSYPVANALATRSIPFVFSTGYDKSSLPDEYQNFPILQKPYTQEQLGEALMKLLGPEKPIHQDDSALASVLPHESKAEGV